MSGCGERRASVPAALLAALLSTTLLAACAAPRTHAPPVAAPAGTEIAGIATALIGTRYHFGGADAAGFDCSGLALYAYEQAGIPIPRTAAAQQRAAQPVPLGALAPGDLVFFHIHSRSIDHVGIYTGDGRFVHAPRPGQVVSYADLGRGFYAQHLVAAGRFWQTAARAR
jgi:cell wall-associated NlpC family hydrolase